MQIAFYLNSTWMSSFGLGGRGPIAVAVSLSGAEYLQCDTGAIESRDGGGGGRQEGLSETKVNRNGLNVKRDVIG